MSCPWFYAEIYKVKKTLDNSKDYIILLFINISKIMFINKIELLIKYLFFIYIV